MGEDRLCFMLALLRLERSTGGAGANKGSQERLRARRGVEGKSYKTNPWGLQKGLKVCHARVLLERWQEELSMY